MVVDSCTFVYGDLTGFLTFFKITYDNVYCRSVSDVKNYFGSPILLSPNGSLKNLIFAASISVGMSFVYNQVSLIIIIIIIIIIDCNWVVTRWQWLFYMYTEYEIRY